MIQDDEYIKFVQESDYLNLVIKSAIITKKIVIEFVEWLHSKECEDLIHDYKIVGEDYSTERLYQEFLKTKQ